MVFYSSKKILINSLLSLMGLIAIGLAFQNCSNGLSSSAPPTNSSSSVSDSSGLRIINDDSSSSSSTTTGSTSLKIDLLATDLLKVDCSIPGASYKFEVSNAGADITMCQEYILDMPQGNVRYGESSKCDSGDKFVKPSSAWSYDSAQRKWSKTTQTSGDQYVPGDYRLYVRDSLGEARSALLKIRHYGYANCVNPNPVIAEQPGAGSGTSPTSGGTTTTVSSCSWSGNDFSPAKPPTSACNQNRANAKENGASGIEYTCVCTQATVIVPPSSGGSTTAGGGAGNTTTGNNATGSSTPGVSGACNPPGTTLVEVKTDLPNKTFQRTDYANVVTPMTIYSFSFKTANTSAVTTGELVATKLSNSIGNKWLVISPCKGDIRIDNKDAGCAQYSSESTAVYYVLNKVSFKSDRYCNLKPNTQYYANVVSPGKATGLEVDGCTSVVNCGFSFNGQ